MIDFEAGQEAQPTNEPTAPPLRDENGFEIDQWGLPVSGPARAARLAETGQVDPQFSENARPKRSARKSGDKGVDGMVTEMEKQDG